MAEKQELQFNSRPFDINSSQWEAIVHEGGHLLVVAGPGTGKTHTLTRRILRFIPQLNSGQKILAITFTHKAAAQMRGRLSKHVPALDDVVTSGTFHYFCLQLLRGYFNQQVPGEFRVAGAEDIESIAQELWPDWKARQRREMLEKISLWKARDFESPASPETMAFNQKLWERALFDFDDLLLTSARLLREHGDVAAHIHSRFPYIFVDEYQDINAIQQQFLKLLVGPDSVITAIGDPNQAIYGFRGSDVGYFASFSRDFPGATIRSLSDNYRSAQNLLSASGQVMAASGGGHPFVPRLTAKIYAEGRLVIHEAPTDKAEAEYVVHQIEKLVGGTSMFSQDSGRVRKGEESQRGFGEIAVLFRLNSQKALVMEALDRSGIPYHIQDVAGPDNPEDMLSQAFKFSSDDNKADKVSLMTLHAAKGLEFPVVFIIGCEQNLLPLDMEGMTADGEEERRLFYVGMTRAKEGLYLVRARRRRLYGKTYETKPSEFLADIEEELKEYERVEQKTPRRSRDDEQLRLF